MLLWRWKLAEVHPGTEGPVSGGAEGAVPCVLCPLLSCLCFVGASFRVTVDQREKEICMRSTVTSYSCGSPREGDSEPVRD